MAQGQRRSIRDRHLIIDRLAGEDQLAAGTLEYGKT
jgi:hypothetical protein